MEDSRIGGQRSLEKDERVKAMGPDGIPIKVWRCLRDIAIVWLTKMFNNIFRSNKMSEEWRRSILVPIYKNKISKVVLIIWELS